MAATDSTLKTQMYLGESQRQNALDFSKQISGMFSAISEGQKFAGDVNRSMVQSALNYKQVEMEEYYKNEALKMDARKLAIAEQETKIKIGQENRRIDIAEKEVTNREKYYTAIEEEKKKSEEYKVILGEIDSDTSRYASMIAVKNAEIKTLEDQRQAIASSATAQLNALPATASDAEREAIRVNAATLMSKLDSAISEHRGAISPLTSRLGDFIALKSLASGRSRAVSDIAKSLTELRTPKQESTSPEFSPSVNDPSYRSDPFQSQPLPVPQYQYRASDIQRVLIQPRGSDYNPEAARYVFDRLPDAKKAELDRSYNYYRNEIFDAYFAPKEDRPSSSREEPDGIDFVDRFNALANKDVMGIGSEASRIKNIAKKAYDDYYKLNEEQRKNKPFEQFRSETLAKALGITETNPNLPPKPTVTAGAGVSARLIGGYGSELDTTDYTREGLLRAIVPDAEQRVLADISGESDDLVYQTALAKKKFQYEQSNKKAYTKEGKIDIDAIYRDLQDMDRFDLQVPIDQSGSDFSTSFLQTKKERLAELIKNPNEALRIILEAQLKKDEDLKRLKK